MARSAMTWIINELRRKVHDIGVEQLDDDIVAIGDTVRLKCTYYNLASTAVSPTNPKVNIINPRGSTVVSLADTTASTATGVEYYDWKVSTAQPDGIYNITFTGSLGATKSSYPYEVEVRGTQRIWSDDELQNYLDKHRIFIGSPIREELASDLNYKRYLSKYDTFEWATLYNTQDTSGTAVTPTSSNLVAGEFEFTTSQSNTLYLEGHAYDIYTAAAECLEELAGDPSRSSQWSRGGVSHKSQDPLKLAQYYRYMSGGIKSTKFVKVYS